MTDFAQHQLGEIVYLELPAVGAAVTANQPFGVVESLKTASDLYAPLSGSVTAVNLDLQHEPTLVNDDPYGRGWLIKVSTMPTEENQGLLSAEQYSAAVELV